MATISSLGLSGLPLDTLLDNLRTNEQTALTAIKSRQTSVQAKISAYGIVKNAVSNLGDFATKFTSTTKDIFNTISTKVSNTDITVQQSDSTQGIVDGNYSINVMQLATQQNLIYSGVTDKQKDIGSGGSISYTVNGKSQTISLDKGSSLQDIANAINQNDKSGIQATIINNGQSTNNFQLLISSKDTGTSNEITNITVNGNTDLADLLDYDNNNPSDKITVNQAQDAIFSLNGITISSATNTVNNAIDGLNITLNKVSEPQQSSQVNITHSNNSAKQAIQDLVTAYNGLLKTIKNNSAYNIDTQTASPLTGDYLVSQVQSKIREALTNTFNSSNGMTLASIGITTNTKTGELEIDNSKLDESFQKNGDDIKQLLSGDNGIAKKVSSIVDTLTSSTGSFTTRINGLNSTVSTIQRQYDETSKRIDEKMAMYQKQFTQLDSMVTQMKSLGTYLNQQLSSLSS